MGETQPQSGWPLQLELGQPHSSLHVDSSHPSQVRWRQAPPFQQRYPETWGGGALPSPRSSASLGLISAEQALFSPSFHGELSQTTSPAPPRLSFQVPRAICSQETGQTGTEGAS